MVDNSLCTDEALRWNVDEFPRSEYVDRRCELTKHQEDCGLHLARITRRQDIRYLEAHPEIRAITTMLLNAIWINQPRNNLADFCAKFFSRPRDQIEQDLEPFLPLGHERKQPRRETSDEISTFGLIVSSDKDLRSLQSADMDEQETVRPSGATRSTVSAVCTVESLYVEEEEEEESQLSSSISFASSVEMMLDDLKASLLHMRMQLGLEDIPEERESSSDSDS